MSNWKASNDALCEMGIVGGSACDKPLASQDDLNNKECVKKERLLKVRGEAMDVSVLLFGVWSCENFYVL